MKVLQSEGLGTAGLGLLLRPVRPWPDQYFSWNITYITETRRQRQQALASRM